MKEDEVMERMRNYFSSLLNETNKYQLQEKDESGRADMGSD